jgi:DNA-binding transcriptional regulator YiaG
VTQAEIRALLRRADARRLREDAGIRLCTVAAALGVDWRTVHRWEIRHQFPCGPAGVRWAKFISALERREWFLKALALEELDDAA